MGSSREPKQIVVRGRPWRTMEARDYYGHKPELWAVVTESLDRLRAAHDIVVRDGSHQPVRMFEAIPESLVG